MGSGSLHQWVAWGAVVIVVLVIFIAVADEKSEKGDKRGVSKKDRVNRTDSNRSVNADGPANKVKRQTPEQEEAAIALAQAQSSKVLIPPPGEKRIEAVAPRNFGRTR